MTAEAPSDSGQSLYDIKKNRADIFLRIPLLKILGNCKVL